MAELTIIQRSPDPEQSAAQSRTHRSIAEKIRALGQNRIGALILLLATVAAIIWANVSVGLLRDVLGHAPDGRRRRSAAGLHAARPGQRRAHGDLLLHGRARGAPRVRDRRADELVARGGARHRRGRRARDPRAAVRDDRRRVGSRVRVGNRDLDRHGVPRRRARAHRPPSTGSPSRVPPRPRGRRRHRRAQHHRPGLHRELHTRCRC